MSRDYVLRGGTVVRPGHATQRLDILVRGGHVAGLLKPGEPVAEGVAEKPVAGLHVLPGCIDAHVHFGFGEKITEYEMETAYAAQGGITTIVAYFLNNEAYGEVFRRESEYAKTRCRVDYGFHFSTASELHIKELESYVKDYGVTSFKYFMNFKGEEGRYLGLDGTDDGYLYDLLRESSRIGKPTIVCHTENIEIVNRVRRRIQAAGGETLKDWAAAKPAFTEAENCIRAMYFAEQLDARVYFPHLSSRLAVDEVRKWRSRYGEIYAETCPHYLTHCEDSDIGPIGKANPPFKSADDRDALWEGLADGTINVVGSDHSARRRATKEKPLWLAAQGFPGIDDPAGAAVRRLQQGAAIARAHRRCADLRASEGLRPATVERPHRRRKRRRLHDRRREPRARRHAVGVGLLHRLQPVRRAEVEGLAGRDDRARRHRDEGSQADRRARLRQVPATHARR